MNDERKALMLLRAFVEDVLPQIGKLCVQDFAGLNEGLILSDKVLKQPSPAPEDGNPKWAVGTLREAVEYLDANSLNQISSGSVLHRCMRGALDAAEPAQELDDQAFDRNAELLTAEALGTSGGINPNATSIDDLFLDESPVPELERPEVVGTVIAEQGGVYDVRLKYDPVTSGRVNVGDELVLRHQHDRIVGALLADAERWKEQFACMQLQRDHHRDRADAAQARVAELDMLLRELNTSGLMQFSTADEEKAVQVALSGAPVVQAGQVPEGYALVPLTETEAMHDAVMALLYKGLARQHTQALLDAYIAAAPKPAGGE